MSGLPQYIPRFSIQLVYGIQWPAEIAKEFYNNKRFEKISKKIETKYPNYKVGTYFHTSDKKEDQYGIVGVIHNDNVSSTHGGPAFYKIDSIEINKWNETDEFKKVIGQLFETVINFWKEYETNHSDNNEILLPENLEFNWYLCKKHHQEIW